MANAGLIEIEVPDPDQDAVVRTLVLYPTDAIEEQLQFGAYSLSAARNAPLGGERLPLVIVSHGGRSSGLTHRGWASDLARAGYVVALPDHPGDCRGDNPLHGTVGNLSNRPRHVTLAIDAIAAHPSIGPYVRSDRVGLVGHSIGGYTALAAAGARVVAGPHETEDGEPQEVHVPVEPRIAAIVLLAPACAWFAAGDALARVACAVLLLTAELDALANDLRIDHAMASLPGDATLERIEIAGAGHHAFQTPFPETMVSSSFPPSQDPAGFDRAAFQPRLGGMIETFLQQHI